MELSSTNFKQALKNQNVLQLIFILLPFLFFVANLWPLTHGLNNILFGYYGDQVFAILHAWYLKYASVHGLDVGHNYFYGFPAGISTEFDFKNQILLREPFFQLSRFIGATSAYNFLIAISYFINFLVMYILLKRFRISYSIALFGATMFAFHPYVVFHSWEHLDLVNVWLFPFLLLLFTYIYEIPSFKSSILWGIALSVFLICATLISNYYGFFLIIVTIGFGLYSQALGIIYSKSIKKYELTTVSVGIVAWFCFVYFYFLSPALGILEKSPIKYRVNNTHEDFVIFSSRPWYMLIPPSETAYVGDLGSAAVSHLQKSNNYLTANYFYVEHAASYLNIIIIVTITTALVYFIRRRNLKTLLNVVSNNKLLFIFLCIALTAFLVSLPPVIVLNNIEIYLPSYLIYKTFAAFRVLARLSFVTTTIFIVLSSVAIGHYLKNKSMNFTALMLLGLYLLLFFVSFVRPRYIDLSQMPKVYLDLRNANMKSNALAVFPYSLSNEALFWTHVHEKKLMNPRNLVDTSRNFDSLDFTQDLTSEHGLNNFIQLGGSYLLVKNASSNEINFFDSSRKLELLARESVYSIYVVSH